MITDDVPAGALAVELSARWARSYRSGGGPHFLELRTYRYYSHTSDDDDRTYRSRDEVEEWRKKDPIIVFEKYLKSVDLIDDAKVDELKTQAKAEVTEQAAEAEASDFADVSTAAENVYADIDVTTEGGWS